MIPDYNRLFGTRSMSLLTSRLRSDDIRGPSFNGSSMHPSLNRRFTGLSDFESTLSTFSTNLERGDSFETLAKFYLDYFQLTYQSEDSHFPRVDGSSFPDAWVGELGLGNRDLGIDGIYRRSDDKLVAVQVKFRSNQEKLTYSELATFWAESENAHLRMVFTNVLEITDVAKRRRGHLLVSREQLDSLDEDFWQSFEAFCAESPLPPKTLKSPRPYQELALDRILMGFAKNDRGKLIAACGIGKTLIGLWATESLDAKNVLFLAPNLQLIRQTLNEWAAQTKEPFEYLAVCSDGTISSDLDEISDALAGQDIDVTTDPLVILKFLARTSNRRKVVFSTYQSLPSIAQAFQLSPSSPFDFAVFDEAHKTTGLDSDTGFGYGLNDDRIPIRKRLFLTATEKLFSPRVQAAAADQNRVVFSMDDPEVYGPTFHRLSFSQAIREGIISDYRIIVAIIAGQELRDIISQNTMIVNTDDNESTAAQRTNLIVNQAILKKVILETGAEKLVSYHSSVRDARAFASGISSSEMFNGLDVDAYSVDGSMPSSRRSKIIREFESSKTAVLTNARCLVEGVDIPIIDGVFFAAPKSSLIDIVQAVGRALRKPINDKSNKIAAVVVPVVLDPTSDAIDVGSSNFDRLYNVIQALRDQDEGIADQVDQINMQVATRGGPSNRSLGNILQLLIPAGVSLTQLEDALTLRIAEVNGSQTGSLIPASLLGAGERGSSRTRNFRTMGDYTPSKFQESLINPTLERFSGPDVIVPRSALKVNNNNVGHSEKLGLIETIDGSQARLTPLGKLYLEQGISFNDLFKNQLFKYRDRKIDGSLVFPYRTFARTMQLAGPIEYLDFLYGIYPIDATQNENAAVSEAVDRINKLRALNLIPKVANEKSRLEILDLLTESTSIPMTYNDVWTDRTTTYNQFRYFRRHLELFGDVFADDANVFSIKDEGLVKLDEYLDETSSILGDDVYGSALWISDK